LEEGTPVPLAGVPRGDHAAGGTIFYSTVEGWTIVDALYFSVTTLTTVGLGDLAPTTTVGKLFTVVYIFARLSIILGFIETVAKETVRRRTSRGGGGEDREDTGAG
jgi:voltage-gated potassium channel